MDEIKRLIQVANSKGLDIPDKLKDYIKLTPIAKQIELDNKMSRREKIKAKAKLQEQAEEEFEKRTGIRNEANDINMENLITEYEYDMARLEQE